MDTCALTLTVDATATRASSSSTTRVRSRSGCRREGSGRLRRPGAVAEAYAGRTRTADAILNQLEGDGVADEELVERAERRVATVEEHLATVGVADETVALTGVNANDPTAGRTATGRQWLIRLAGTGGRLWPLVHGSS